MLEEDLKPLREYYCKNTPKQRVVLMNVDYHKKNATLFYKGIGDVRVHTFEWCKDNLVVLNEFNQ